MTPPSEPLSNPNFTGVQLGSFGSLARQVSSSGAQLEQLSHALWSELDQLGVSTAPAMRILAIAQWVDNKGPELQQRYQAALQWARGNSDPALLSGGYVPINESHFGDAALKTREGDAAAGLVKRAAKGDQNALKDLLANYANKANNPYFAAALMKTLGPKGLVELPASMARRLRGLLKYGHNPSDLAKHTIKENATLLKFLNSSLAAATDTKNPAYVGSDFIEALKQQGRAAHRDSGGANYYGYWGLGQILHASHTKTPDGSLKDVPFGRNFLTNVGGDMITWDRQQMKKIYADGVTRSSVFFSGPFPQMQLGMPNILNQPGVYPPGDKITSADPLAGLAEAASTNRKAAQDLLDYPPDSGKKSNLSYLLHDRRKFWGVSDHGDALGHMLEAAEKGHDSESKRLAVWTTWIRANDLKNDFGVKGKQLTINDKDGLDALSGMRDSEANILAYHIDAVIDSLGNPDGLKRIKSGDVLDVRKNGATTPHFGTADLDRILVDAGLDDGAYQTLINAQSGHMRATIDKAISEGATDLKGLTGKEVSVLAHIVQARGQGLLADGRLEDKRAQMRHDALAKIVQMGVGYVPIPGANLLKAAAGEKISDFYKQIAAMGYDNLSSKLAGQAGAGAEDKALTETTNDEVAASSLIHQMIQSSILDHGTYEHTGLHGQPFVRNGNIDPELAAEEHHYVAFRDWLESHSKVLELEQHGDTTYGTGHTSFNANLGLPRDA
jgi:hypothetical protein